VNVPEIHIPDIDIPAINMVMVTSSARSGLMVENLTPQLGEFFGVKNGNGVLVRSVEKGSRAEKAGLRAGDVIVKINEQPVHDTSDFAHAVRTRNGGSVSVGVIRDRKEQNLNLMLPDRKESGDLIEEESSDDSVIDAESVVELSELQQEVAELKPQMQLAVEDAQTSVREVQKDLHKELCGQQQKMHHQAVRLKNEVQRQQEQFKKDQEHFKMQLEQLPRELRGRWLDI
jgi:membrane-associated protease RseP (regulator of RpoE activity)